MGGKKEGTLMALREGVAGGRGREGKAAGSGGGAY